MSKHTQKETAPPHGDTRENRGKPVADGERNQAENKAEGPGSPNQGQANQASAEKGPENLGPMEQNPAENSQTEKIQAKISPAEFNSMSPEEKNRAFEAEFASWEQKSAEYEAKIAELNDQYLRKAADFENFRKRMNREKQEITEFANQNLLLDLITVIDDFERAIKSAETSKDFASFYEGIMMIEKRHTSQLESKWALKRFDSVGDFFDPNRHEALQMEKLAGISEPVVKEEYVKGYFLKERVIRFAKVKVAMPETASSE